MDYQDIPTEGISHITATDIRYANAMGRAIKLLADSKMSGDTYSVRVAPFLLLPDHPLYHVDGVFNAIFVHGNMLGDGMFYGSGAGKLPTASAVVADMVDMAKHIDKNIYLRWDKEKMILADPMEQRYRYFVRAEDDMDAVKAAFGDVEVVDAGVSGENGFVTGEMSEREYRQRAGKLSGGAADDPHGVRSERDEICGSFGRRHGRPAHRGAGRKDAAGVREDADDGRAGKGQ